MQVVLKRKRSLLLRVMANARRAVTVIVLHVALDSARLLKVVVLAVLRRMVCLLLAGTAMDRPPVVTLMVPLQAARRMVCLPKMGIKKQIAIARKLVMRIGCTPTASTTTPNSTRS